MKPAPARFATEEHVLGDGALRQQVELLEHGDETGVHRLTRVRVGDLTTLELHGAGVGLVHARDDLHEGRLAGAVLADEAVHLASTHIHVDAGQHGDAEEALRDAARAQHDVGPSLRHRRIGEHGLAHEVTSIQDGEWAA